MGQIERGGAVAAALVVVALVGGVLGVAPSGAAPSDGPRTTHDFVVRDVGELTLVPTWTDPAAATDVDMPTVDDVAPPAPTGGATGRAFAVPGGEFVVSFGAGFSAAEMQAVEAAATIWASVLDIDVPVRVRVDKDLANELPSDVLGGASPTQFVGPEGSVTTYSIAQGNQLAGADLNGGSPEISVVLSEEDIFDTGLDASVPAGRFSLVTLALHELGHGLGFVSWSRDIGGGQLRILINQFVNVFDSFVRTAGGADVTKLSTTALQSALRNPLRWGGPDGTRLNGNKAINLYAPPNFEPGSSVAHVSADNHVLAPFINPGVAILSVSNDVRGMFADMGWPLQDKSGNQAFVAALARDFLGRDVGADELRLATDALRQGLGRPALVELYAYSDEWIGVIVDDLYRSTLGRLPDASGRAYWIGRIRAGVTPAEAGAYFYASPEFYTRSGGTNRSWVRALYVEILGRTPDTSGWNFWTRRADLGTPRSVIAFEFYQSIESRRRRVVLLYRELLQRSPDTGGREYWAGVLQHGRDVELAIHIASGAEYYSRASSRF